jgi:glycosyltransferase involved in cell wall biosynthesis
MAESELGSTSPLTPLVSVSITAYNSAAWLARAIDSVLAQRTGFPFEIVIGDDCSADATVRIAREYRDRMPDIIRILERPANLGIQRNYYETFEQCRGKFIAWLDADDYWTDPEKLTVQAEAMEFDPTISLCCHFVREVTPDGKLKRDKSPLMRAGSYGLEQILQFNFVPSPSAMFRNGIHRLLPAWYFDLAPITDWPIWVLAACMGRIVLLDRVMADYTLNSGSAFAGKGAAFAYEMDAQFYEDIESVVPAKWHKLIRAEKRKRYESMAYLHRMQGDYTAYRNAAVRAFCSPALMDDVGSKTKTLFAAVVREILWRFQRRR